MTDDLSSLHDKASELLVWNLSNRLSSMRGGAGGDWRHYLAAFAFGGCMTETQAREILNRVRAGDKTPTRAEINLALVVCGDITSLLSPLVAA